MNKRFPYILKTAFLSSIIFLFIFISFVGKASSNTYASAVSSRLLPDPKLINEEPSSYVSNCRYGTTTLVKDSYLKSLSIPELGAGWFLSFFAYWRHPMPANNAEFVHVIKPHQIKTSSGEYLDGYYTNPELDDSLGSYIRENPGGLWIIGNEVDRGPNPGQIEGGQGDMYPDIYATAYHEIRAFIKSHDPTARTAISGLVQVTPGRLQYLDKVWNAYLSRYGQPMIVDIWNMHIYVLPELEADGITPNGIANIALGTDWALGKRSSDGKAQQCNDPDVYCYAEHDDLAVFGEQVLAMRQWMKDHGQQQKPLILSEFSILYPYVEEEEGCYLQDEYGNCFTPDRVSNFMRKTFAYLNQLQDEDLGYALDQNRLVQQWLWFSMYTEEVGNTSNLLQPDKETLSQLGETFRQAVYAEPIIVNLLVEQTPTIVTTVDQTGTATVPLWVTFRNNGNTAVEEPFTVTFYEDQARENEIGSVLISERVRGCTTQVFKAEVTWPDLIPGKYRYWVTIDSENVILEGPPEQQDNEASGLVAVYTNSNLLPLVIR